MRLVVFDDARLGLVRDDGVVDVSDLVGAGRAEWPPVFSLRAIADFDRLRPRLTEPLGTRPGLLLSEVQLAAPVVFPSKGQRRAVNYRLHIEEMRPLVKGELHTIERDGLFLRAPSSVVGSGGGSLSCRSPTVTPITRWSWAWSSVAGPGT